MILQVKDERQRIRTHTHAWVQVVVRQDLSRLAHTNGNGKMGPSSCVISHKTDLLTLIKSPLASKVKTLWFRVGVGGVVWGF